MVAHALFRLKSFARKVSRGCVVGEEVEYAIARQAEAPRGRGGTNAAQRDDTPLWDESTARPIVFKSVGHALGHLAAARTAFGS